MRWYMISHIEFKIFANRSIWPTDGTLTGTTTLGQNGPGINDNEGVIYTLRRSRNGASPLGSV